MTVPKKLYRFINFFELLRSVRSQKLRVSSAANFEPNDLLGVKLHNAFGAVLKTPLLPDEFDALLPKHEGVASFFISSWTTLRSSVAMWEIYGRSGASVQIEMDGRRAHDAFETFCKNRYYGRLRQFPPLNRELGISELFSGMCQYVDFDAIFANLKSAYEIDFAAPVNDRLGAWQERRAELRSRVSEALGQTCPTLLKDVAYHHECEYRFSFQALKRNSLTPKEIAAHPLSPLVTVGFDEATTDDTSGQIWMDFDWGGVNKIWLHGLSPEWENREKAGILEGCGLDCEISEAYGFRPKSWV